MPSPRTHGTIDIDDLAVFYETEGDGETIVLLHGGLADNSTWAAQFSGLSPHRRVVAPERQAQGHTPDRPGPLTYQAMADQTVSFLAALGLGPVDLLGWSDGGMVGTLIAAEHPELVRTLTVTGSGFSSAGYVAGSYGGPGGPVTWRRRHGDVRRHVRPGLPGRSRTLPEVWEKMRTMWAEPFDWTAEFGISRHRLSSSSAMTTTSASSTQRSSPALSPMGSSPLCQEHLTSSRWRSRISSTSSSSTSRRTRFQKR